MSYITKIANRDLPDRGYIEVTAQERDDSGTLSPGFSITASVWYASPRVSGRERARRGTDIDAGGADHDLIAQVFPDLQPIIDVHLADPQGVPMYAKANGWHFYSGAAADYEREQVERGYSWYAKQLETSDHDRAARALRVSPEELPTGLDKEGFYAFIDSLTERYAADAAKAREVMASMTDGRDMVR